MSETAIIIAIGNSDNKLTQAQWSLYWDSVDVAICHYEQLAGFTVYARWVSASVAPRQSAGWSISVADSMLPHTRDLQNDLRAILPVFSQDSLAWTVGQTRLIPAMEQDLPKGICTACQQPMQWINAPTGGWWSHVIHPADNHDAEDERPEVGFE